MHDTHFHYSDEILKEQNQYHIPGICNVANLKEYETVTKHNLCFSCGIHPWQASEELLEEMFPVMVQTKFIGEIGMDSVWCDVDMTIQRKVFIKQLAFAKEKNKPVILHTKGQEKQILDEIRKYPNTYLVHWYSCEQYVDEYNEVASYFTVGPSIGKDRIVTNLVKKIPIEKLLLETDGIDAIEWATGQREYYVTLQHTIHEIAMIKKLSAKQTEKILDYNFEQFLQKGKSM